MATRIARRRPLRAALVACFAALAIGAASAGEPEDAREAVQRGDSKRAKDDLDGAVADYTRAIEIDPRSVAAYRNRGAVRIEQGDVEGAHADHSRAIELDPRDARTYVRRGLLDWNARKLAAAASDLRKALAIDPTQDYARFFLFLALSLGPEGEAVAASALKCGLEARGAPLATGSWVETVDRFLRRDITATELETTACASPDAQRLGHLCEAYFYAGMTAWIRGEGLAAKELLEKCVATEKSEYREHAAARAVLKWPAPPGK